MSAGRRGLILSVTFLGLALWLCPNQRAKAQPIRINPNDPGPGKHTIWKPSLGPDQIRDLLGKFGLDDGKGDPFEDLLRRLVRDQNPDAPKDQLDEAVKRFMNDKEFRDRVIDLAQRHKNQMKDNGPPPKLTPEDRAKLEELAKRLNIRPDGQNGGDPFKLPEAPLPPFDPRNPDFDPKRFPAIDPDNPPKFDRDTRFPLDPKTGRPFDPRNGQLIDPQNPPRIDPVPPKFDPLNPPKIGEQPRPPQIDPKMGPPVEPPNNDGKRKFDPENPLGNPNEAPDKSAKNKAVEAVTALWEKNIGPIDESPSVKKALIDLVSDPDVMDALTDSKGRNIFEGFDADGNDRWGGLFDGEGGGWEWPKFDFNWGGGRDRDWNFDFGGGGGRQRNFDLPSRDFGSRGSGGPDFGSINIGSMKVPLLLLLILAAVIVAAVAWRKWGTTKSPVVAAAATGPPPWPVDPRAINTREDLVKAFEYLSVLICGPGAKMWTHSTIADELSALVATHGETAVKLARLYELARYSPPDEPLTRAELMEARRLVCDLAGMETV